MEKLTSLLAGMCLMSLAGMAHPAAPDTTQAMNQPRIYLTNSADAGIFSTSLLSYTNDNHSARFTTLRFSYLFNAGISAHYDISRTAGVFSGLHLQNLGFIEKSGDYTIKRRVYTIGVPVGIKVGDMSAHGAYWYAGAGLDIPINFKEKKFITRNNKAKLNEWFSDRTPAVMPYMFVGYKFKSQLSLKLQYYPGNFLNTSYENSNGIRPYQNYNVHLLCATVGYSYRYRYQTHWKGKWMKRNMI
ncbi:MAG: hypothetical protein EBZ77_00095 [Chitinophagia bacterium]|nr:hypothetical protein [Chitinophagia bacterium]